ncbi:pyridoxamine 5'-phosphate oxidase-related FMN-binding [Parvibaculum lavamentivorans DS-1]|uniref:Pyridoxamine 5'-phosphate oxidase-related FMN-binding n=1 Tax=Parvibaculum lavamentivorans (strain DS-1 / DSM 13023 / NCIMB 13966) TaxID=402881 RepID=A7HR35_PARL1|nr:pyridoxamine 5'-phosphate oxidase family protein [Parvibaculum lavamentivorans]ABS62368.1 pyridoxamine 5'-phosphate oxidase-related FMN-binding [Parvibaculum lavamentivorans DS-1]
MADGAAAEGASCALPEMPYEGETLRALTLSDMGELAFALPARGVADAASPLRKPVFATLSASGAPAVRTIFLRALDRASRRLVAFTDSRSTKVAEIARDGRASLLFYDPRSDVQVRLSGRAVIRSGDDEAAEAAWQGAPLSSRRAYLVTAAPGSPSLVPASGLPADVEGMIPSAERLESGRVNFALLEFAFDEADILVLSRTGHRRARIRWQADKARMEWLVP